MQLQDQQRFLEEIAIFLTNEQANSLFERCDIPILTKTGIQYVKQPPLDKFGGLARKKRAMVRSNIVKN